MERSKTSNINLNSSDYTLSNWGVFTHSGTMPITGTFTNYGVANVSGGFNVNNKGYLYNYGDFNVAGDIANSSAIFNYASIEVSGHYNNNSDLENYCTLIVTGNFSQNKSMLNYGYVYVGGRADITGGTTNEMYDGAMIKCTELNLNSNVNGNGTTSGLEITTTTRINAGSITGAMDICDANGIESNNGTIASTVTYCKAYIPTSPCNPEGYGTAPSVNDTDGDGVTDAQDEFPNDKYRAHKSYYVSEGGSATVLFEDLWPSVGDYDFNDLVLDLSGYQVLNASNKVVEIYLDFEVKAVGASNTNGFGVQLSSVLTSAVQSVNGAVYKDGSVVSIASNGTEIGQTKAVVVAVEDIEDVIHRVGGSMFNTVNNGYVGTSDVTTIKIVFGETTPIDNGLVSLSDIDVFLICNQERGWEVHTADVAPTGLVSDFWGTANDTSNPATGRYYKTSNNLPWGLVIVDDFSYPYERVSILDAYPDFAAWALSGGVINQNWYLNAVASKVW